MPFRYLCPRCKSLLNMEVGHPAVNDDGKIHCAGCDSNEDNLRIVDSIAYDEKIREWSKGVKTFKRSWKNKG